MNSSTAGSSPPVHAPQVLAVEVADHGLEKREVEIGQPLMQRRSRLLGILHHVARATDADVGHDLEGGRELRLIE